MNKRPYEDVALRARVIALEHKVAFLIDRHNEAERRKQAQRKREDAHERFMDRVTAECCDPNA